MSKIEFKSHVPVAQKPALEALLFFNSCQERVSACIADAIEKFGSPEIVADRDRLRIHMKGLPEVQSLFAIDTDTGRPVGVAVYARQDIEHVIVVHVGISAEFASGGRRANEQLLLKLLREVRRSTRRVKGVRTMDLYYATGRTSAPRWRAPAKVLMERFVLVFPRLSFPRIVQRRRSIELSRDTVLRKSVQLASLALVGVWLALLAGLLGRWAWPLDLFAHFRVQYAALFALLAVITLLLRQYVHASAALLGFAISAVPLFAYLNDEPLSAAIATPREQTFRLVSFNVWFRNPDLVPTAQYIEQSQADAVVLLELTPPQAELLAPLLPSYPYYHIEPSRMGAAVFTKWPVIEAESVPLASGGAVAARLKLDWRGAPVTVLGVHLNWPLGPRNSEFRNQELNELVRISKEMRGPLIVAGDFNLTPWSEYFSRALAQSGLHDAARGFGLARSWPAQFAPAGIRIDHCLLSPQWRSVSTRVGPFLGSDHLPIIADLTLQQ